MKNLPEDAYKGQQQKLKQNLIQKAKLKKRYARVLKQEGMEATPKASLKATDVQPDNTQQEKPVPQVDVFTRFDEEDEVQNKGSKIKAENSKGRSYRQRARERKPDTSAVRAQAVRAEREQDTQQAIAERTLIEKKRSDRVDIKKRELSRTKKGQPLMKDRMQNILARLQTEAAESVQ